MRKYFLLFCFISLLACSGDRFNNSNPYLSNVSFSYSINTSLPAYSSLQFPSNPIVISGAGAGIQGIIVMKSGGGESYVAWEASCPNQYPTSCSKLYIEGINAKCSCENFAYSIYSGAGGQQYGLKPYRVEVNGNVIRVYN